MYLLRNFCHRTDIDMGVHGFCIDLHPDVPALVEASGIDQEHADTALSRICKLWLQRCGFKHYLHDGDDDRSVRCLVRIGWGEWGPEHISVPGNACGLDISDSCGCLFPGGRMLSPHNVDTLAQKYLLTTVFCFFVESIYLQSRAWETSPPGK